MKRTVLVGVAMFLLGGAASPRAANNDETLALLCHRFKTGTGGMKLDEATKRLDTRERHDGSDAAETAAVIRGLNVTLVVALASMRDMVCVK